MTNLNRRISSIDIAKLLFAYLILIYHVLLMDKVSGFGFDLFKCWIEIIVPFFFVTSGYLIFSKICNDEGNKNKIVFSYLKRILILYLVWQIIMIVFRIPEAIKIGTNFKEQLLYWGKYFRVFVLIGDYQLWYLIGLVWALLIFLLLYRKNLMICVIAAVILWGIHILIDVHPDLLNSNIVTSKILYLYNLILGTPRNGLLTGFSFLIVGCLFAKYKKYFVPSIKKCLIMLIIFILFFASLNILQINDYWTVAYLLMPVTVAILFALLITTPFFAKTRRIGNMSSLIYVSHMFFVLLCLIIPLCGKLNILYQCIIVALVVTLFSIVIERLSSRIKILKYLY